MLINKAGKSRVVEMVVKSQNEKIPVLVSNQTKCPKHIRLKLISLLTREQL